MGVRVQDGGIGIEKKKMKSHTRTLTFKNLWRIKLVGRARFRDRNFGADLDKGRTRRQVTDATRHDHQELCAWPPQIKRVCTS